VVNFNDSLSMFWLLEEHIVGPLGCPERSASVAVN